MKKIFSAAAFKLCLIILITSAFSACRQADIHPEISARDITSELVDYLGLKNMTELNREQIALHYSIDVPFLEDESVYISTQNNNADEIAVFKLNAASDTKASNYSAVTAAATERISQKLRSFEQLNPAEFEKVGNSKILTHNHGDSVYIALVICENSGSAYKPLAKLTESNDWVEVKWM